MNSIENLVRIEGDANLRELLDDFQIGLALVKLAMIQIIKTCKAVLFI